MKDNLKELSFEDNIIRVIKTAVIRKDDFMFQGIINTLVTLSLTDSESAKRVLRKAHKFSMKLLGSQKMQRDTTWLSQYEDTLDAMLSMFDEETESNNQQENKSCTR